MKCCLFILTVLLTSVSPALAQVDLLASWDGSGVGSQFGIALALGGDADGDGAADLAVGASTDDSGGENAGKVSIFFGRSAPAALPDLEITGDAGSFFGSAVAWAGDVNADGFDDLLVGAFRDSSAGGSAGKASLFLGGDPMDGIPDLVLVGPEAGAYFGRAVCGAGNLNGDQYADFAVGAPRTTTGTVFVYFGGDPPDGTADLVFQGAASGDRFGTAIASAGEADGIPGDDLLVGAPRASAVHTWEGEASLFSGGAPLDTIPDWLVRGVAAGDQFGTAVAGAGDVNGDGAPDILIGAPYRNVGGATDAGEAYIYYGGALLDTISDFLVAGTGFEDRLGRSLAGCGDVTGSGYSHFLVGAAGGDAGGVDTGYTVLSPGGDPPSSIDLVTLNGESGGDQFGYAVGGSPGVAALSFSGQIRPDFAVGAWSSGAGGRAYIYGEAAVTLVLGSSAEGGGVSGNSLLAIAPNPGRTFRIRFDDTVRLSEPGKGGTSFSGREEIRVFDIAGRLVRRISLPEGNGGFGTVEWDGRGDGGREAPPGVYFVRLDRSEGTSSVRRVTLVR